MALLSVYTVIKGLFSGMIIIAKSISLRDAVSLLIIPKMRFLIKMMLNLVFIISNWVLVVMSALMDLLLFLTIRVFFLAFFLNI